MALVSLLDRPELAATAPADEKKGEKKEAAKAA
jgi:hypothetical protein